MSRISHKYKFIFFSFPKTGSESVRKILNPHSDIQAVSFKTTTSENPFYSHITPEETKKIFESKGWKYDEYFKFTCIRNPFTRLYSLYKMRFKNMAPPKSFHEWVRTLDPDIKKRKGWTSNGQLSFYNFIHDSEGNMLVDEVIKLEQIDTDLPKVLAKLGIKVKKVPKENVSEYRKRLQRAHDKHRRKFYYRAHYTEQTRKMVRNKYRWEIVTYGYKF